MKESNGVYHKRHTSDQRGMAAIVITMVTMVVISLIVIGFATVSRREQRQSLDQLQSTQAFYAAESGIEDARAVIKAHIANGQAVDPKSTCTGNNPSSTSPLYPINDQTIVDTNYDSSYTCLKVDPNPDSVEFAGVGDNSIVVPIKTASDIGSVEISWQPTTPVSGSPASDCPAAPTGTFKPQSGANAWKCGYAVLRASLVPTGAAMTRDSLSNSLLTGFFVPTTNLSASGRLAYGGNTNKSNVTSANCTATPTKYTVCKALITNLNPGVKGVSLRINSIYQPSNISIRVFTDNNGNNVQSINGVQAVVDSTGKATDVLRRIRVRLPLIQTGGLLPGAALTSNGAICKRFSTTDTYFSVPGDIKNADPDNKMCAPQTVDTTPPPVAAACSVTNDIVMVLDSSGSMKNQWQTGTAMDQLKTVATKFVQTTQISPKDNHAAIVTFSSAAQVGMALTGNKSALLPVIDAMFPKGGTVYTAGLSAAENAFTGPVRAGSPKIMVFISDGAPDESDVFPKNKTGKNRNDIIVQAAQIRNSGVIIYTIGINGESYAKPGDPYDADLLKTMAGDPSRYFDANSEANLDGIMQQISTKLKCKP